jgi:DNA uptake protein ComE-like DNA-binding protein
MIVGAKGRKALSPPQQDARLTLRQAARAIRCRNGRTQRRTMPMLKTLILAAALGLAGTAAMAQTATQPATRPAAPAAAPAPAATPAAALIDINSATEAELRVLNGIGEARARAIIAGRPYRGKDELVRKNIIPQGVYDGIQARIIARQR